MNRVFQSASLTAAVLAALTFFAVEGTASDPALARGLADPDLEWGPCPDFFPAGCQIAVLHGDPSKPNADVFFRIAGEYVLPSHTHSSAERMILVAGELHITYAGQEPAVLKPGMYAYGPPNAPHWGKCVGAAPCVLFIAFEEPVDATQIVSSSE